MEMEGEGGRGAVTDGNSTRGGDKTTVKSRFLEPPKTKKTGVGNQRETIFRRVIGRSYKSRVRQIRGAFHYARATGQRTAGLTEENGMAFSDQTGPTKRIGSHHFFFFKFLSRIPYICEIYWRE